MVAVRRTAWEGTSKTLVVSIDVGTTFTAASFCILEPGEVPVYHEVLRWPKQTVSDAKIPSVILYDTFSRPKAFGAETTDDEIMFTAEEEQWRKVEWWKLHFRPAHLSIIGSSNIPALPINLSVDRILADFLRYVKQQVEAYVKSSHGNGSQLWSVLFPRIIAILTAPNGWEGSQQQRMRAAAVVSGLVNVQGEDRVRFVSEAEAAILFAIDSGCIGDWIKRDGHLVLCDCGGGTVDITSYEIMGTEPLVLRETSIPRCSVTGAVFVTNAFRNYLQVHLQGTEWADLEVINHAVAHFEANAKRKFSSVDEQSWVDLGGFKSASQLGIVRGKLKIDGTIMARFFERSIASVKNGLLAVRQQVPAAENIVLVGGLASSPYVYRQLEDWASQNNCVIGRPDGPMSKAVANGALSWYIQNPVSARMNRHHYGVEVSAQYDPSGEDMVGRSTYRDRRGDIKVENVWDCIVSKDAVVSSSREFYQPYRLAWSSNQANFVHTSDLLIYRGDTPPKFLCDANSSRLRSGFEVICSVSADLKPVFDLAKPQRGKQGHEYREVQFEICLDFGETELKARIRWEHDGSYKSGSATITYLPSLPSVVDTPPPYVE